MVNTNKQERFEQLLDVIYEDITLPYNECRLGKWKEGKGHDIPATLDPEELLRLLNNREIEGMRAIPSIPSYSRRDHPSLSELSAILENHKLGRESFTNEGITDDFKTALKRLDDLDNHVKYLLFEYCGHKWEGKSPLVLSKEACTVWPTLRHVRYVPVEREEKDEKRASFSVDLAVEVNPTRSIEIGQDYILPSFCKYNPALNVKPKDICLRGYRIDENSSEDREYEKWHHFSIYTDENKIRDVVRESVSSKMLEAVREVAANFLGGIKD